MLLSLLFLRGRLPLSKDLARPSFCLAARRLVLVAHVHMNPLLLSTCRIDRLVRPLQSRGQKYPFAFRFLLLTLKSIELIRLSTFGHILSAKGLLALGHLFVLLAIPLCFTVQLGSNPLQLPQALLGVLLQGADGTACLRHSVDVCVL